MKTEVLIHQLRVLDCEKCYMCEKCHGSPDDACLLLGEAADRLLTQQARITQLEAELIDERYRHDRVQDFEVAEAQELAKLRQERRWIPVGERLPEPDKQVLAIVSGRWENITFDRAYELASWSSDEGWVMEAWPELEDPEVTYWMSLPEPPEVDG